MYKLTQIIQKYAWNYRNNTMMGVDKCKKCSLKLEKL